MIYLTHSLSHHQSIISTPILCLSQVHQLDDEVLDIVACITGAPSVDSFRAGFPLLTVRTLLYCMYSLDCTYTPVLYVLFRLYVHYRVPCFYYHCLLNVMVKIRLSQYTLLYMYCLRTLTTTTISTYCLSVYCLLSIIIIIIYEYQSGG